MARVDVGLDALRSNIVEPRGLAREISRGLLVLGLTGSSVGGLLGVVAQATRLLGR